MLVYLREGRTTRRQQTAVVVVAVPTTLPGQEEDKNKEEEEEGSRPLLCYAGARSCDGRTDGPFAYGVYNGRDSRTPHLPTT